MVVEQQRRMQELEGKKMKMQEEMAARAANSTEQERQTMIAHHEEKLVQPEVKTCKDSEDDMLRQKLEARKKKKQALQKRKQQEEVNEAALAGGDAEAEVKKRVKAAALQELQQMVLTGDLQGAVRLLRQAHEKEVSELRTAHSRELASKMAGLPDGADAADAERSIQAQHEAELANLATHQQRELKALEMGTAVEDESAEAEAAKLQAEKEEKMKKITQDAEKLKAKYAEELQQMEAELEEQMQRERELFDAKRKELGTRAMQRRQKMAEEEMALSVHEETGEQTKEQILEQHESDKAAYLTSLREQEALQSAELQRKLAERKISIDARRHKEIQEKFQDDVQVRGIQQHLEDLDRAGLSADERQAVLSAVMVTKLQTLSAQKKMDVTTKYANRWLKKVHGRELSTPARVATPRVASAYDKVLSARDKGGLPVSPLGRMRSQTSMRSLATPTHPETKRQSSAIALMRSNSFSGKADPAELTALKGELESARVEAEEQARRAKEVEDQLRHMQEQKQQMEHKAAQLQSQLEEKQAMNNAAEAAAASTKGGPSRDEWVKILEASPLSSMQSKLTEVEELLRTLLSQRKP